MASKSEKELMTLAMECMIISHDCACHYQDNPKGVKRGKQEAIASKINAYCSRRVRDALNEKQ